MRSRAGIHRIAAAPDFTPRAMIAGARLYSLNTSTPAARNAATPHSTARFIAGVPVTRPPTSSVTRRKLLSRGDAPITIGKIFSAACSHEDGCVVEQPGVPCGAWRGFRGFGFAGGSCAAAEDERTSAQSSGEKQRNARRRILVAPWVKRSDQVIFHRRNAARIITQPAGSRLRREARIQNAVNYAGDLRHFRDVVDPYDVRAAENARRDRSRRAPNAVFRRGAASVARQRRAEERLARSSHQQRTIEPRQLRQPCQQFVVLPETFSEADPRIEDEP